MDSTREGMFRHCRHSDQDGLPFLSHDEFSILSEHLNLTYIYNPLSADPTLARHVVHKLQRWTLKMSVFSYRMEHVMGELKCLTDLMTIWGVGWIAGSERKAHSEMASLFAQPYITQSDFDKVELHSRKEILLAHCRSKREASKARLLLVNKNRRSKSMLVA
jgi:hypothetical protein